MDNIISPRSEIFGGFSFLCPNFILSLGHMEKAGDSRWMKYKKIRFMKKFEAKLLDTITNSKGVQILLEAGVRDFSLVGGAVYGAQEGYSPKDYDLLNVRAVHLLDRGFTYSYETEYSTTFTKDKEVFQVLKTELEDFDFTIAQIQYRHYTSWDVNKSHLIGDLYALQAKRLVPVDSTIFENRINQLLRKPHYEALGFNMNPIAYEALIRQMHRIGTGNERVYHGKES